MKRHIRMDGTLIGDLYLVADDNDGRDAVVGVYWAEQNRSPSVIGTPVGRDELLAETRAQLREYFEGKRFTFTLPLHPHGTEFQGRVWDRLQLIPYGSTCSYQQLADATGSPRGSRAVGLANGRNPIPVIIPCHRVIGADGSLTGYGGGIERKRALLALEARSAGLALF